MEKRVKKKKRGRQAKPLRMLAVCYAAFVLLWLLLAVWRFAADRMQTELLLDVRAAAFTQLEAEPGGMLVTTGVDPQMVWQEVDHPARLVLLEAGFTAEPGEMELFYTRKEGQGFAATMRVIGAPQPGGGWLYRLPGGNIRDLRVDMGTISGNMAEVTAVVLNPRLPAASYFVPTLRDVMAALLLPALACCAIYTIMECVDIIGNRRQRKNAGKQQGGGAKAEDAARKEG